MSSLVTAQEALSVVKSGQRIYIHSVAAFPQILVDALVNRKDELTDVEIVHLHTEGNASYTNPDCEGHFRLKSFFVGANVRKATQEHRADYIPVFLSEVPNLIRNEVLPIDVALVQVSVPDAHGYCSLGVSVDATLAAVQKAKTVIAQINPSMPRTLGDGCIHVHHFDYLVEHQSPIPVIAPSPLSAEEIQIGKHISELVEDGATLQMGIGNIPNAVLAQLGNHRKLGVHTEMFSDGIIPLVEKGVITGEKKKTDNGKIVSSFVMGSEALYEFIDNNPGVLMMDVAYVNDVSIIRKNPKVTSINSAIEIDYTGQVCADSIGTKHFSGVGGQMDFIRGASYSKGGKPIIAMTATTNKGASKIVSTLKEGAGVVTTRANVHWIVSEFGAVNLYGKSLKERTKLMISIAHPDHRDVLEAAAFDRFGGI
ncbi:MAG: 4-hydroxybutyrate CoA-transferase [Cyclobacteriaceae bacterium]|jgi:4-hydroxybutyrate CoA-transferase